MRTEDSEATQLLAEAMRDPVRRAELDLAIAHLEANNPPGEPGYYTRIEPTPRTITFRNNLTGEMIEVPDSPAARALAERKRLPRAERRAQEKGARKLLKKTRKSLLRTS